MYFKLAYKNVKKSYQDFFVYFVTLTISIALFYVFNSFDAQSDIFTIEAEVGYAMQSLELIMSAISRLVAIIFGVLILYANNFLIKRRKLELAIYSLLGMDKLKIGMILLFETLIVGFISLVFGLFFGVILSQISVAFSAKLLIIPFEYEFIFSLSSLIKTSIIFMIIFLIVGLFNNLVVSRAQLIDLMKAKASAEVKTYQNNFTMALALIASINILWFAYSLTRNPLQFIATFMFVIPIGIIGTLLLFKALAYWLIKLVSKLKGIYFKDLNMFVIQQLNFKVNSTYKLLAVISLMLLVGFGALASSFYLSDIVSTDLLENNPYDISFAYSQNSNTPSINVDKLLEDELISDYLLVERIATGLVNYELFEFKNENEVLNSYSMQVDLISESVYNQLRKRHNLEEIDLNSDEMVYFVSGLGHKPFVNKNRNFDQPLSLFDEYYHVLEDQDYHVNLRNGDTSPALILVFNDENFNYYKDELQVIDYYNSYYINADMVEASQENLESLFLKFAFVSEDDNVGRAVMYTMQNAKEDYREIVITFTYSGLYIGLVFIIVSVMVLSLQVLSDASDNYERYDVLSKLGVSEAKQRNALFKQTLFYFMLPLGIALVHSYVGIKAVVNTLAYGGYTTNSYLIIYFAVFVLVVLYLLYFLISYYSSLVILKLN